MKTENGQTRGPAPTRVIAFDGSILDGGPITGVGRSFLTTLCAYAHRSPFECVLLLPRDPRRPQGEEVEDMAGVRTVRCLTAGRWRRLRSLREGCLAVNADLLHSPVTAVPSRSPCPLVATIHDLPWFYPELRGESGSRWMRRVAVRLAVRAAAAILVPSRATLADLRRFSPIEPDRVLVVPHGVAAPGEVADPPRVRDHQDDGNGPFLILGDDRPRKNNARLRRAHAIARERDPGLPSLQFVGPNHGFVEEPEKRRLLENARALVHVSLLEGFGLPVLEAFAHGTPVLCSDRTSLPEVAGDAALLVDPTDEVAIAEALVRIHRDPAVRRDLRERGLERVRRFTPQASASAWRELHERILSGPVQ